MNETWAQILLGLCCTAVFGIISSGAVCVINGASRLSRVEASVEFLIDATGRLAAKKLHSPDDHLGIDFYLDEYIKNHHDMSMIQWQEFKEICKMTRVNSSASKEEKA